MKIGIIGAGNVGGNLGKVLAAKGHHIMFGVRDPQTSKVREVLGSMDDATIAKIQVGNLQEAAAFGEVVVISVPGPAVRETVHNLGDLAGKILIDTTNRFASAPGDAPSAAEDIARLAPGAKVVKAFNTMGAETLLNPNYGTGKATAFICGDDDGAKATVMALAEEIGLDTANAGKLSNASVLEEMVKLWIDMVRNTYGRNIAFSLLHR